MDSTDRQYSSSSDSGYASSSSPTSPVNQYPPSIPYRYSQSATPPYSQYDSYEATSVYPSLQNDYSMTEPANSGSATMPTGRSAKRSK